MKLSTILGLIVGLVCVFSVLPEFIVWLKFIQLGNIPLMIMGYGIVYSDYTGFLTLLTDILYTPLIGASTLTIKIWNVYTYTSMTPVIAYYPIYFWYWIIGWYTKILGWIGHGYFVTYGTLASVPISGYISIIEIPFILSIGVTYEQVFGGILVLGTIFMAMFTIRTESSACALTCLGMLIGAIMCFLGFGLFELKLLFLFFLGLVLNLQAFKSRITGFAPIGVSLNITAIVMYLLVVLFNTVLVLGVGNF